MIATLITIAVAIALCELAYYCGLIDRGN